MTLWILWSMLTSGLIAVAAAALARAAGYLGAARRFVWVGAMIAATALAIVIAFRPATTITPTAEPTLAVSSHIAAQATRVAELPAAADQASHGERDRLEQLRDAVTYGFTYVATVAPLADTWIARAWLAASVTGLALLGFSLVRLHRRRLRWSEATIATCGVLVSRDVGPAVVGVVRPRIVVPRWAVAADRATRELLLRHELEHMRTGDSRVLFGATVLRLLFPWNAALWWMARQLRLAIEIDCDTRVIRSTGDTHAYGLMLLAAGEQHATPLPMSACLSESGFHLEARINAMTAPRRRRPVFASLPFAIIALVVLTTAAWAPRPAPVASVRSRSADPKALRGNTAPRYPESMRASATEGHAVLKFTTDARGVPDTATIQVVESTNDEFVNAVRGVLPSWRYDSKGVARLAVRFMSTATAERESAGQAAPVFTVDGRALMPVVITTIAVSDSREPAVRQPADSSATPPPSPQPVTIPNTPVGRAFRMWLSGMNGADRSGIDAFVRTYPIGPDDAAVQRGADALADARSETGGMDLVGIRNSTALSLEFIVRERHTGIVDVGFIAITADEPARGKSLRWLHVPLGRTADDGPLLEHLRQMRP